MKISGGMQDQGIVIGNAYNKYESRHPAVRWLMKGFADSLSDLVDKAAPRAIHEIGCGEGYWILRWHQQGIEARGSDFSEIIIQMARKNAQDQGMPDTIFDVRSIYAMEAGRDSADLIVCCEVLEHLDMPEIALKALGSVVTDYLILSVPREPIWRLLNLARGKYVASLGNTPGHIQHWSSREFIDLVSHYFDIIAIKQPLPWTMLLCRLKQ